MQNFWRSGRQTGGRTARTSLPRGAVTQNILAKRAVKPIKSCITLLVFVFCASFIGWAQQITGSIVGTVKDQQGALVTTATVTATNTQTALVRSVQVNGLGEYRIDYLPVGTYNLQADAAGFQRYMQQNVVLTVDQTQTLDVTMEVGSESQTVTITGAPPEVDTSSAELGRTISPTEIIGLPLVNRDAYEELSLIPGVMANNFSQQSDPSGVANFNLGVPAADVQINGSTDGGVGQVSFYLDGGLNMSALRDYGQQLPNPDALEEFRVETSDFSAQYGRGSAAVVTAVTKSGTNQFHGALFEFNRNTDLNAFPWNAPKNAQGQFINAPYHRNNFGGVIGGPIKKDKAFFFFSYGGLRQVIGAYVSGGRLPTAAERLGDFTGDTYTVYMPGTKTQVDGINSAPNCLVAKPNCIPIALLDPTATNITSGKNPQAAIPLPNTANSSGAMVDWTGYFTGPTVDNEYVGKYDEALGTSDHLSVSYFYIRTTQDVFGSGNIAPWVSVESFTGQTNANISEIHPFSPNTINQAWVSFSRAGGGRLPQPAISLQQLGSAYTVEGPPSLPDLVVSGDFTAGNSNTGPVSVSDFYSVRDSVSMTRGKHTLSFGAEQALEKSMIVADTENYGVFTFNSSAPTTTGNAMSDFMTGMVSSLLQATPYNMRLSAWHTGIYLQDNYRITPRLTANLGIRWDFDTPPVESENRTATFVPSEAQSESNPAGTESTVSPTAPPGMFFPGDPGVPRGITSMRWHHVSPRAGLAWDVFGNGKTALHAAAGVFYGGVSGNEWGQPSNAAPFAIEATWGSVNSLSNPYAPTMVNGTPSSLPNGNPFPYYYTPQHPNFVYPASSVITDAKTMQWPFTYQFNASFQQQLPQHIVATVAYAGTISRDVPIFVDANYAPYVPGLAGENSGAAGPGGYNARRPYDQNSTGTGTLGEDQQLVSTQGASYHSLQVSVSRSMTHNLMLNGFYVWSHALESANIAADGIGTAQDWNNLWEERGPMSDDRRNVAAISGIWNIDYFTGSNVVMKNLLNGWRISPIYYIQSGEPTQAATGSDNNDDSQNSNRPDLVPGVSPVLNPHRNRSAAAAEWFNTAAFVANGPGVPGGIGPGGADGNEPMGGLRAPGYRDVDLGVFRDFKLERGAIFQLRGEANNVFNLVNLNPPSVTGPPPTLGAAPSSSTFGVITSALSPRIIQVGARLTF
jgi:Carboxypeptidase regulatory-like domain